MNFYWLVRTLNKVNLFKLFKEFANQSFIGKMTLIRATFDDVKYSFHILFSSCENLRIETVQGVTQGLSFYKHLRWQFLAQYHTDNVKSSFRFSISMCAKGYLLHHTGKEKFYYLLLINTKLFWLLVWCHPIRDWIVFQCLLWAHYRYFSLHARIKMGS